jgi:hypothetical protein
MRRATAAVLTLGVMGLWLWSAARRPGGPPGSVPTTPAASVNPAEARVQSLLESASKGELSAYLVAFSGPLRDRIEREARERGREAFAADLRASARSRKSHAVFSAEPDGPASSRVTVEAVYPDWNERQTYRVEQAGASGPWLVTEVETVRSRQPKGKFDSPAAFIAPEGNPVDGTGVASPDEVEP